MSTQDFVLTTPVLFLVFNRPETTERVFEAIRQARPKELYISADGPRQGNEKDQVNCRRVKEIVSRVDWPCKVVERFQEKNFGCREAVSSGISWFFSQVEMGIVLEDDCLPHPSFFGFAQECLLKYKDDERIFHINGSNYLEGWRRDPDYSYYFSSYQSIWGWASWRRAWNHYDVNLPLWKEVRKKGYYFDFSNNRMEALTRRNSYDAVYHKTINTWDYQWSFAMAANNGLAIIPGVNLISNIGFEGEATHTHTKNRRANLPTVAMPLPLSHPHFVIPDRQSESVHFRKHMRRGYTWRLKNWRELLFGR